MICLDVSRNDAHRCLAGVSDGTVSAPANTPNPATTWTVKAGHHGGGVRGGQGLPHGLFEMQVGTDLGAPALGPAPEDVSVVQ
jgi:hypothetical protein